MASYKRSEVAVWDVASRKEVARLKEDDKRRLQTGAIAPDGGLVAFPEYDAGEKRVSLALWNWRTGQLKYLFRERTVRISALQFSPDGRTLAVAFLDSWNLACWNLASGEEHQWGPAHTDRINALAFSQDSKILVSGSDDQSFKLWDLSTFQLLATRECTDRAFPVSFSPDGQILAVVTRPKIRQPEREALTLWNWPGLDRRPEVLKTAFGVGGGVFSPDGKTLAVIVGEHQACRWRPFADSATSTLAVRGKAEAWSVAFSPDSRTLAAGYDDQAGPNRETLKLWDVATRRERANLYSHSAMVSSAAFAPDGRILFSGGYDNLIKNWDAQSGGLVTNLKGHTAPVRFVVCSPDGRMLASGGKDNLVRIWDTATGLQRFSLEGHVSWINAVAFAPNGKEIASGGNGGQLRFWDVATGQAIREIKDTSHIMALAYAPSGLILASANLDGIVRLHDLAGEREPRSFIGHRGEARAVAFSPDGKTLATGGEDRTVRLWHVSTGRESLVFKDLPQKVNSLAFSPDGRHLAAALHDGSVRLWHAAARDE